MSYTQSLFHVVFRTKDSQCNINFDNERILYHYIYSTSTNLGCHVYRIGGMPDHVHICVGLPASLSIAQYVEAVKVSSSKRFSNSEEFPHFRGWSTGYAALSLSYEAVPNVIEYIKGQKTHHESIAFRHEYHKLIESAGININEEFFLKD